MSVLNLIKEINYLFDRKLKIKSLLMVLIIFIGSVVELLGVAVIMPIINLVMDPEAVKTNKY